MCDLWYHQGYCSYLWYQRVFLLAFLDNCETNSISVTLNPTQTRFFEGFLTIVQQSKDIAVKEGFFKHKVKTKAFSGVWGLGKQNL